jgi:hypothetical protein
MSLGNCAAVLKTASRANPAVHLPYHPRLRVTPHRPSRNVRRYDWSASSGSVVANDPVNKSDPTGLESPCITLNSGCWGDRNDPETAKREERAGMVMTGVAVVATAAVAWEYVGAPAARFLFGRAATSEVLTGRQASTAFNAAWEKAGFSSAKEVGNVVGWGGGRNAAAQATARIADITKSAVAGMREQGLTKAVATAARDVYRAGVAEGTGGATAAARLKLMEQILKKW